MSTKKQLPQQLETERLIIKVPKKTDGSILNEAIRESFDALKVWLPWATHLPSQKESEDFCIQAHENFLAQTKYEVLLIEKKSGDLVGVSSFHAIQWDIGQFEVGYWGRTKYWGNGFVTEGVSALIHYAKTTLNANRISLTADNQNVRSCKVAERLGFTLEGILHLNQLNNNGMLRDSRIYAMWKPFNA